MPAVGDAPAGPRSGSDDYLVLANDLPNQYGIEGADDAISAPLEGLRGTGARVRLWGLVSAGVIDWNGTQIRMTRVEVLEMAEGTTTAA